MKCILSTNLSSSHAAFVSRSCNKQVVDVKWYLDDYALLDKENALINKTNKRQD